LLSIALIRVLSEYLSPEQYGVLALLLTIPLFFNYVYAGGLSIALARFYSVAVEEDNFVGFQQASGRLFKIGAFSVAAAGLCLMIGLYGIGQSQLIMPVALTLLLSIFSSNFSAIIHMQSTARYRATVTLETLLEALLRFGFVLGGLLWIGGTTSVVLIGYTSSAVVVLCISQFIFANQTRHLKKTTQHNQHEWQLRLSRFIKPFLIFGIFGWIQSASDRWALQAFTTEADVGKFAVLFQIGFLPMGMVGNFLGNLISPILYRESGNGSDDSRNEDSHRKNWKVTQLMLSLTLVGTLLAWLLHGWIFRIVTTPSYHGVSDLLPWMVFAGGLFYTSQSLVSQAIVECRPHKLTKVKVSIGIFGALCNISGAAYAGVPGVVAALVICSASYLTWGLISFTPKKQPKISSS
jgi:O-antigen/teichoic acid export membrane protein